MVRKEGGSGIFKIAKLLAIDLQQALPEMGYEIKNQKFSLEISIDPTGVIV